MPNGNFEPLAQGIQDKLIKEGVDGVSEKELLVWLVVKVDRLRAPFWKTWTIRELVSAAVVVLGLLGVVNWDRVASLLTTIASAAGTR